MGQRCEKMLSTASFHHVATCMKLRHEKEMRRVIPHESHSGYDSRRRHICSWMTSQISQVTPSPGCDAIKRNFSESEYFRQRVTAFRVLRCESGWIYVWFNVNCVHTRLRGALNILCLFYVAPSFLGALSLPWPLVVCSAGSIVDSGS